jgi:hypothetical protein
MSCEDRIAFLEGALADQRKTALERGAALEAALADARELRKNWHEAAAHNTILESQLVAKTYEFERASLWKHLRTWLRSFALGGWYPR